MSKESNNRGRAYEFAFINVLHEEITKARAAEIVQNSSLRSGCRLPADIKRDKMRRDARRHDG